VSKFYQISPLAPHPCIHLLTISIIAKLFDRDPETNELLWFPAPPLNTARPAQPKYSMAYLQFLAKKRKAQCDGGAAMDVDVNADGDCDVSAKRARTAVLPTVTETLAQIMKEVLEEGRQ